MNEAREAKKRQVQKIIRLRFIENYTQVKIATALKICRPTVKKYLKQFENLVSDEDLLLAKQYKDAKRNRRVPFPPRWNKYVKQIMQDFAKHPKTVATPENKKRVLRVARENDYVAMATYLILRETAKRPSYTTTAKMLGEYKKKHSL